MRVRLLRACRVVTVALPLWPACVPVACGGYQGYAASDGFVVDISPPVARFIHEGDSALVDDDAVADMNVTVTFGCRDIESGVHHAEVSLENLLPGSSSGEFAFPWAVVPQSSSNGTANGGDVTMTFTLPRAELVERGKYETKISSPSAISRRARTRMAEPDAIGRHCA